MPNSFFFFFFFCFIYFFLLATKPEGNFPSSLKTRYLFRREIKIYIYIYI